MSTAFLRQVQPLVERATLTRQSDSRRQDIGQACDAPPLFLHEDHVSPQHAANVTVEQLRRQHSPGWNGYDGFGNRSTKVDLSFQVPQWNVIRPIGLRVRGMEHPANRRRTPVEKPRETRPMRPPQHDTGVNATTTVADESRTTGKAAEVTAVSGKAGDVCGEGGGLRLYPGHDPEPQCPTATRPSLERQERQASSPPALPLPRPYPHSPNLVICWKEGINHTPLPSCCSHALSGWEK